MDLSEIYSLRTSFTIIGLTGRTGSGCSEVAGLLENGFDAKIYPQPDEIVQNNTDRKYNIVYKYGKEFFQPYYVIKYKDVLSIFLLDLGYDTLCNELSNFYSETIDISSLKSFVDSKEKFVNSLDLEYPEDIVDEKIKDLYTFFESQEFKDFSFKLHEILEITNPVSRIYFLQYAANNIRNGGCITCSGNPENLVTVYNIVTVINKIIKGHKKVHPDNCKVGIDSLRNPLEIMFLKERYSAFYMMTVNSYEVDLNERLLKKYDKNQEIVNQIKSIDKEEYKGGEDNEFYNQNVSECIQKSDIHLSYISEKQAKEYNDENLKDDILTSPKFSIFRQLLKYVSLIEKPGIVTPSPEERCMQMAYSAKYNSGCISRQVGAVITDNNYSIKAVGWNNTSEGHTPCLLRNVEDLINKKDTIAFSKFEKEDSQFKKSIEDNYADLSTKESLKGLNVSFCFKCIHNSLHDGKNQVHTRSLHAEESAFLQITKYGGQGIKGGKLFTTASPCELCAKKAYQLGIKVIYYIDFYPGISVDHILEAGKNPISPRLFHGAVGSSYFKLYSPFMAYKDELSIRADINIVDKVTQLNKKLKKYKEKFGEI